MGKLVCPSSHSPQGECGLKLDIAGDGIMCYVSLPARGVWIEIGRWYEWKMDTTVTPRKGSVD